VRGDGFAELLQWANERCEERKGRDEEERRVSLGWEGKGERGRRKGEIEDERK